MKAEFKKAGVFEKFKNLSLTHQDLLKIKGGGDDDVVIPPKKGGQ